MKKILLPLIMALVGIGGGVGAGFAFKPEPETEMVEEGDETEEKSADSAETVAATPTSEEREYAKMNNQFIVPVVDDGRVTALVVLSLNLEVGIGTRTAVFAAEPKLRDGFLQVMFNHANIGGFSGNFTSGTNMRALRRELLRVAKEIVGEDVFDVLIIDIVRQDS